MNTDAIVQSLDIASEQGGDLTARVYRRLFAAHPEMEALFVRDTQGAVRGEMLARVFEMVLDYIDRGAYAANMIQCEVMTHDGYGVPPDLFPQFFDVVAASLAEACGSKWTPEMEGAWNELLGQFRWYSTHPQQAVA